MEHCEDYLELISAGIDGQLTEAERKTLNDHLDRCPDCRALRDAMAENSAAAAALGSCEPPENFVRSVMDRIDAESTPARTLPLFRRPRFKQAMAMAACALLCVGVVRFSGHFPQAGSSTASGGEQLSGAADSSVPSSSADDSSASPDTPSDEVLTSFGVTGNVPPGEANASAKQEFTVPDGMESGAPLLSQQIISSPYAGDDPSAGTQNGNSSPDCTETGMEEYGFSNPTYTRLDWSSTLDTGPSLISSREELDQLLSGLSGGLDDLSSQYTEQWFSSGGRLIAVILTESSGSVSHQLSGLRSGPDGVEVIVQRQVPQTGTCDMAAWVITAETDLPEGTPLSLLLESQ